jgi:hypothetical protein
MPTATKFNALGAGNGFPFCLTKVDVSGYDYWTTLGGNQKGGSVTESGLGLREAMSVFWNAHALNCNATTSGTATIDGSISRVRVEYKVFDYNVPFPDPPILIDSGAATPKLRVCIPSQVDGIVTNYVYRERDGASSAEFLTNDLRAMYNGATTSEGNFVGYGLGYVETRFQSRGTITAEAGRVSTLNAGVYVGGFGYTPDNTTNDVFGVGYVTLSDLNVFAYVEAKNGPNDQVSGSVNLSALSASCTLTSTAEPPSVATANASLSSIDFYTY